MSLFDHKNYRKSVRTQYTLTTAADCIRSVLTKLVSNPTQTQVAKLLSQARFETGGFKYCWNNNWGNDKRAPDNGLFHMIRCNEIIGGKAVWFDPPHIQCCFAAYASMEEGAQGWAKLILEKPRYGKSREKLLDDTVPAYDFAFQLGVDGYYTASKNLYSTNVQKLMASSMQAAMGAFTENERHDYIPGDITASYPGRRELRRIWPPMEGDDVREWIDWLTKCEMYDGINDAKFGPKAEAGTIAFQRSVSLPTTGATNPATVTAMKRRLGIP